MNEPMKITDHRAMAVLPDDRSATLPAAVTPMDMLAIAVKQGADLDKLRTLMELKREWEADEARKAWVRAMTAFKANPPEIFKRKSVDIKGGPKFKHAELAEVVDAVIGGMARHELSHRWVTRQETGAIHVTCIVTHAMGHSEETSLLAAPDTGPGRNSIQAIGSTITYLQRYTLMAAVGVAAKNQDDDGTGAGKPADAPAAPEGYSDWRADMTALADEGLQRLTETWSKSSGDFRRYVIKADEAWWGEIKAKAVQADKKAKQ